jgi:hypothetical protein
MLLVGMSGTLEMRELIMLVLESMPILEMVLQALESLEQS